MKYGEKVVKSKKFKIKKKKGLIFLLIFGEIVFIIVFIEMLSAFLSSIYYFFS